MKRRLVAVTLSLIMTMATVSEAGAAAFTSPDTALAVATQTDAEEVNVTEETSEQELLKQKQTFFQMEMMGQQYHHRNRQTTHLQRERIRLLHCRTRRRQQQMLRMPLEPL